MVQLKIVLVNSTALRALTIPVDVDHPENNFGVLVFTIDEELGPYLQKTMMLVLDGVTPAQLSKYSAHWLNPSVVHLRLPSLRHPWMNNQSDVLQSAFKKGVLIDRTLENLVVQLNRISDAGGDEALRELVLEFPDGMHLDNNIFSPGQREGVIKKDYFQFQKIIKLPSGLQYPVTEGFVVWKVAVRETTKRRKDSTKDTTDDDLLADAFQKGANLND